jgi:hypothetical protein
MRDYHGINYHRIICGDICGDGIVLKIGHKTIGVIILL